MLYTIERLSNGDAAVVEDFVKAHEFQTKFFEVHRNSTVDVLADELGNAQARFESMLDWNRGFAKEVMPVTCLAALYDSAGGFGDNQQLAEKVVRAFRKSLVSIEIKGGYLDDAVQLYGLGPR